MTESTVPDRELLTQHLAGQASAFEALIDRYERPLLRFSMRLCASGGAEGARDVVQEVFLKLITHAQGLRSKESLSSWLYQVTRNLVIDQMRKDGRMEKHHRLAAPTEAAAPPVSKTEQDETAAIVQRKLEELPRNQREVLALKVQSGKSYREIAEITGLTTSNIGYLIHHGLKNLAGSLRQAGVV